MPPVKPTIVFVSCVLVFLGLVTVARTHVWSPGDERAHYSVIQTWAEESRPPRITELISPQALAISENTWPEPSRTDPRTLGIGGRNYEAFQPPLYYLLAVPVFRIAADYRDKIFVLRGFDLLLYLGGALVLWILADRVAGDRSRLLPWVVGMLVLLWPGNLVRGITIANSSLEYLLG